MGVDEGNLRVVEDVDVILENCPITIDIPSSLVYSTVQYTRSTIVIV